VTESKAVERRLASLLADSILNRRLVRAGSPSPANMRVGSSPIRFMGKTPGGEGKVAGQIFPPQPAVNLAGILESGQGDLGDFWWERDSV
jgi:hypothetical protein